MTLQTESYRIETKLTLKVEIAELTEHLPLEEISVSTSFDSCVVSLRRPEKGTLTLDVALTLQLPFDEYTVEELRFGIISWRPNSDGIDSRGVLDLVFQAVEPLVIRLSAGLRLPELYEAFLEPCIPKMIPTVDVTVAGQKVTCSPVAARSIRTIPPRKPFRKADITGLMSTPAAIGDYVVARSDRSYHHEDLPSAIAWLTTAMEVSAYNYLGEHHKGANGDPKHFNPTLYLGTGITGFMSGKSFKDINYAAYVACEELWGTRNEILHFARLQIRTFVENAGKKDPKKLRRFTGEDYEAFRNAVSVCINWMTKT